MTTTLSLPIRIPASPEGFLGFGSEEDLAEDLRVTLAVRLFEEGRVSLGWAAQMAGMHKALFMEELGRRKVSIIQWDEEEMRREFGPSDA